MSTKLTKADLVTIIEGLRAEIETLRITNAQLVAQAVAPTPRPPVGRPAYVKPVDPLAEQRADYRAYREQLKAAAIAGHGSQPVLCFDAWLRS